MGNRAVITTENKDIGIYVHWNGGLASVLAFLDTAKVRGYRSPSHDPSYGMARLCGLLHEFFGPEDGLSLGIGPLDRLDCDNFDNGVYVIGGDWEIVGRYGEGHEPRTAYQDLTETGRVQYAAILEHLSDTLSKFETEEELV